MSDLDLSSAITPDDAQQGLAMAMQPPPQVPVDTSGMSIGGGLSLPQTGAGAPPQGPSIQMPTQTITGSGPPAAPPGRAADLAYNQNVARAVQLAANGSPNSDATVRALRAAGATPEASAPPAPTKPAATPMVASPFAQQQARTINTPAMNVPTANPADVAGIVAAQKGQQQAGQSLSDDEVAGAKELEKTEGGAGADATINAIEGDVKANRAQIDAKEHYSRIRSAYDTLSQMSVDPQRYWKSLDTGHKVMQTLANIFSGFSAGLHGGPNQAIEAYQQRVQADIDAQKDNIQNGYKSIQGQEGLYEQLLQQTGTPKEAEALALGAHQDALKHAIGKVMASTNSREVYDKGKTAWYAAAQQQHETMLKYHKYMPASSATVGANGLPMTPKVRAAVDKIKAKNVDTDTAIQEMRGLGQHLEAGSSVPGTSWTDQLRHAVSPRVESDEAIKYGGHLDTLIARDLTNAGVRRVNEDLIRSERSKYTTPAKIVALADRVEQRNREEERLAADAVASGGTAYAPPAAAPEEEAP